MSKFLALVIVAFALLMGAALTTEVLALSPDALSAIADK
jgi:hypothetical protein